MSSPLTYHLAPPAPLPLRRRQGLRRVRGGRAMRPRLRSASANLATHSTADLSRWTHGVGVSLTCATPTRNAIGLSSPDGARAERGVGELSPWRSILPPPGGGAARGTRQRPNCGGSA